MQRNGASSAANDVHRPQGDDTEALVRAFLIADVRGYTSFTQAHGDEAAGHLAATFASLAREAVAATGKPLIVVLLNGSALAVNWAQRHATAVLDAWYPGGQGGTAIADVIAGRYNPETACLFRTESEETPSFQADEGGGIALRKDGSVFAVLDTSGCPELHLANDAGAEIEKAISIDVFDYCAFCALYHERVGTRV